MLDIFKNRVAASISAASDASDSRCGSHFGNTLLSIPDSQIYERANSFDTHTPMSSGRNLALCEIKLRE